MHGAEQGETAAELLLGEQSRLDRLGQVDLVLGGQQRHPADLPQVDPDQVAGRGAPAAFGGGHSLRLPEVRLVVLGRHVEHIDALVGERAHRRIDGFRRKVGAVERHHDIGHGQGTTLPS